MKWLVVLVLGLFFVGLGSCADKTLMGGETVVLDGDVIWDNLYSSSNVSSWAVVTGPYDVTVAGIADIEFVSFQNTGDVRFEAAFSNASTVVSHSVFFGQSSVVFGSSSTSLDSILYVNHCDFRDIAESPAIIVTGMEGESIATEYQFVNNTFEFAGLREISFDYKDGIKLEGNVFYNATIGDFHSLSGGWQVKNNFISGASTIPSASNFFRLRWDEVAVNVSNNYIYSSHNNPHTVGMTGMTGNNQVRVFDKNVIETVEPGANIFFTREQQPALITNNLMIGGGALLSNVGSKSNAKATLSNNTIYVTKSNAFGSLYLTEGGECSNCEVSIYNNIVDGNTSFTSVVENHGSGTENIYYAGYNNIRGAKEVYDPLYTIITQEADTAFDPQFVSPNRNLATWSMHKGGMGTELDAIANFFLMNGYNPIDKKQTGSSSGYAPLDLITWVRDGYVFGNSVLNTSGRDGGKVGFDIAGSSGEFFECVDLDNDSYGTGENCLGLDCDDSNSSVHALLNCSYDGSACGNFSLCVSSCPSVPVEICGNGVDEDCDGFDLNCSFHEADLDESGVVETDELVAYVERWKVGEVSIQKVMESVVLWLGARG